MVQRAGGRETSDEQPATNRWVELDDDDDEDEDEDEDEECPGGWDSIWGIACSP